MKRILFIAGAGAAAAAAALVAACSSSSVDNTVYGPPDAGKPDAVYCVVDNDCPPVGDQHRACGFPIADGCTARGVCVDFTSGPCSQSAPLCGCNGELVTTCGVQSGYVKGGPTNGATPTDVDGSAKCPIGGQ